MKAEFIVHQPVETQDKFIKDSEITHNFPKDKIQKKSNWKGQTIPFFKTNSLTPPKLSARRFPLTSTIRFWWN
jgi:hypothetical protein